MELEQIKLANAIKLGRTEQTMFYDQGDYRTHGTKITLQPGELGNMATDMVKLTDKMTGETTFTSVANTIYFKVKKRANPKDIFDTEKKPAKKKATRVAHTI